MPQTLLYHLRMDARYQQNCCCTMAQVMKTHVRQTSLIKSLSKRLSTISGLKNPPYPSQNTSPLSCHFSPTFTRICSCCIRCTRNASKATPGSTIRLRLDLVFGSPSTYPYPPTLVIVRCTETKPCLKSMSSHRNANSSPRLIPSRTTLSGGGLIY